MGSYHIGSFFREREEDHAGYLSSVMLKLTLVGTPNLSGNQGRGSTNKSMFTLLSSEMRKKSCWNKVCTEALQNSPRILFGFDRLCYMLGMAFGSNRVIILLNPKMLICYHPECYNTKKNPVNLKDVNNINEYVVHHLSKHRDEIGNAMMLRYRAIHQNWFLTMEQLDELSPSPLSLMTPLSHLNETSIGILNNYGIKRDFKPSSINVV